MTEPSKHVGKQVMLAAGDTFRAAAAEQLQGWAQRSSSQLVARADDRQKPDALLRVALDQVPTRLLQLPACSGVLLHAAGAVGASWQPSRQAVSCSVVMPGLPCQGRRAHIDAGLYRQYTHAAAPMSA